MITLCRWQIRPSKIVNSPGEGMKEYGMKINIRKIKVNNIEDLSSCEGRIKNVKDYR